MKQSGFVLPSGLALYAIAGLVALAVLTGTYWFGRTDGAKIERTDWQKKEKKADAEAAKKLKALQDDKDRKKREHDDTVVAISTHYQGVLTDERNKKDRIIADLRAGNLRLRDPGTRYSLSPNPVPGTVTTSSRCDGSSGSELSRSTSEFLISEASRANEIVKQLTACQKNIRATQEVFSK